MGSEPYFSEWGAWEGDWQRAGGTQGRRQGGEDRLCVSMALDGMFRYT